MPAHPHKHIQNEYMLLLNKYWLLSFMLLLLFPQTGLLEILSSTQASWVCPSLPTMFWRCVLVPQWLGDAPTTLLPTPLLPAILLVWCSHYIPAYSTKIKENLRVDKSVVRDVWMCISDQGHFYNWIKNGRVHNLKGKEKSLILIKDKVKVS